MGICIGIGNYIGRKTTFLTNKDPSNIYYNLITEQGSNILTEMKNLILRDLNNIASEDSLIIISEDNKVIIKDEFTYPGLIAAWSAKGKTNDDEDRAILRDLTGNGHDITLNGFAFNEMSGYGGYWTRIGNTKNMRVNAVEGLAYNKIKLLSGGNVWNYILDSEKVNGFTRTYPAYKVHIEGLGEGVEANFIYYTGDNASIKNTLKVRDGVNNIPSFSFTIVDKDTLSNGLAYQFAFGVLRKDVIFELLPDYPDALVFDGVDDYGVNKDMPLLDDYTIIVKRKEVSGNGPVVIKGNTSSNKCAFIFEAWRNTEQWSFGYKNNVNIYKGDISFMSKNNYNGVSIKNGTASDSNSLLLGYYGYNPNYKKMVFYSAYLFDRSLDEQEIKEFIRKYIDPEYLLPSEIPTPDCYYDFTNGDNASETRETITDLSGNGNNAVAHGFAWNGDGSGYKDGALYFDGVDDYVSLDAFDSGFKTVFMLMKPLNANEEIVYDQRNSSHSTNKSSYFSIQSTDNEIAYNARNTNGVTYINGVLNTTIKTNNVINKKILATIVNNGATDINTQKPIIGKRSIQNNYYANILIYKFLGFKEALTEEQIQYVIKKYNLLDGVDEIEVS